MSFLNRVVPKKMFNGFVYESRLGLMYIRCVVTNMPDRQRLTIYGWSDLPDDKCFKCDLDDVMFMACDNNGILNVLYNAYDYLTWMAHEPQALQDFPR